MINAPIESRPLSIRMPLRALYRLQSLLDHILRNLDTIGFSALSQARENWVARNQVRSPILWMKELIDLNLLEDKKIPIAVGGIYSGSSSSSSRGGGRASSSMGLPSSMLPSLISQLPIILEGGVTSNSFLADPELGSFNLFRVELGRGEVALSSIMLTSGAGAVKTSFDFGTGSALF